MFKSFLALTVRNLMRNKVFSSINIFGLSIGLAASALILIFVLHELSYDRFHQNADRIFRIKYLTNVDLILAQVPPPMAPVMADYFSGIEYVARAYMREVSVRVGSGSDIQEFEEERVIFADSALLKILSFEFISGNPDQLLNDPFKVIVNSEIAQKYFPGENPIGKTITFEGDYSFQIAAVAHDFPVNSHIHFNIIAPFDNMFDIEPESMRERLRENLSQNWLASHLYTYVLLKPGADPSQVDQKFPEFLKKHVPENRQVGQNFKLQPIRDIHLQADIGLGPEPVGDVKNVYLFSTIAFICLLIACINFINLSTAQALRRAREVGMRKAMGAGNQQIFIQFLGESVLISLLALIISIVMLQLLLPFWGDLTQRELPLEMIIDPTFVWSFFGVFVLAGAMAGIYPALYMTKFKIIPTLKGLSNTGAPKRKIMRRTMVVSQFAISLVLISGALVIFKQLNYLRNQPLGFDKQHIATVPLRSSNFNNLFGGIDDNWREKTNAFENEILQHPAVQSVTLSSALPGMGAVYRNVILEGREDENDLFYPIMSVDYDFLPTYGLVLVAGRDFSKESGTDHIDAFIVNEKALQEFEWESPEQALGKRISLDGKDGKVVGVVKDFNYMALTQPIGALILDVNPSLFNTFSIKIDEQNLSETMDYVREKWGSIFPSKVFESQFLDDQLQDQYQDQDRLSQLIGYFAFLAILISCLGSYGLILFTSEQRTKEIGIRKALGASVLRVVILLFTEFTWMFAAGFVLAVPLSWWLATAWLEDFSYRIELSALDFVLSGIITLALVWLTISFQSFRAALLNPVDSLRTE